MKMIALMQWAKNFDPPIGPILVRRPREANRIVPEPVLIGIRYYVHPDAIVLAAPPVDDPVVARLGGVS